MDGRRDQRDKGFQVKAAGSGLGLKQPVALLQVYNVRLLHCGIETEEVQNRSEGSVPITSSVAFFRNHKLKAMLSL